MKFMLREFEPGTDVIFETRVSKDARNSVTLQDPLDCVAEVLEGCCCKDAADWPLLKTPRQYGRRSRILILPLSQFKPARILPYSKKT